MRQGLFILGKLFSYLFPQNVCNMWNSIRARLFTGYKSRFFNHLGKNSTLGKHTTYLGEQYISIGEKSHIGDYGRLTAYDHYLHTQQQFTPQIIIGNNCSIGAQSHISAINLIKIGDNVLTGPRVLITDNSHGETTSESLSTPPYMRPLQSKGEVVIEDNVWIGEGTMIMPNVHVGKGAIIACNSVVTTDIPSFSLAAGSPAKIIKSFK